MKRVLKIGALVVAVLALGIVGFASVKIATANFSFPDTPYPDVTASTDPAVIEQGRYLVHNVAHCSTCHGKIDGTIDFENFKLDRNGPLQGGYRLEAGPFGTFFAKNLTPDPKTGIGRYTDKELARMIRQGVGKDGTFLPMMKLAQGPMSDEDLTAIISFLRAQKPVEVAHPDDEFGVLAKLLSDVFSPRLDPPPKHVAPSEEPSVARGEYLANGPAVCSSCHSPLDPMSGFALSGPAFSGAAEPDPDPTDATYGIIAPNLTSDPETGRTGQWDEEQFLKRMKGGRSIAGSHMPWEAFSEMTDSDIRSIYRYLKSVPPAKRDVGETRRKL